MKSLLPGLLFIADAGMVALTAWLGLCIAGSGRRGLIETTLGWALLALGWIVGSGVLLGLAGELGRPGFFWMHAVGLVALCWWGRSRRSEPGRQGWAWLADWWRLLWRDAPVGWLVLGLFVVLFSLGVLAAQAEPIVFDALTYRLSRIGLWLQDGRIAHYQTDDPRLNYMPIGPDVVIAWLLGATNDGFRLAPLSQLLGGGLLLGATVGLARVTGLSRPAALGAAALVLGMANVAAQFTTIQSDLFTAGVFAASYLLWHRALLRGEGSWVAGVGVALAFGSKGTMFYLAPGAAIWAVWLLWQQRPAWRALQPTVVGALLTALIVVLPVSWRNVVSYGSLFGPRDAVVLHHGEELSVVQHGEKLALNLGTSAVQLLDPNAQPLWLEGISRAAGQKLAAAFSSDPDPYVFMDFPRRIQLEQVMGSAEPDADLVTCGVPAVGLFFVGLVLAGVWRARDQAARLVLVWGGGVVVFLLVQHALVQWHHWAFRFLVLAAPWVGVVGAWGIERLPRKVRVALWTVAVVSALQVFAVVQWRVNQAAWQAVTRPNRALSHFVYHHWRDWGATLGPAGSPLTLAQPINQALAAFVRVDPARRIELRHLAAQPATAEAAVRSLDGWLVVPARFFAGRESHVEKRVWFFNGDEASEFSLAAYRRIGTGH